MSGVEATNRLPGCLQADRPSDDSTLPPAEAAPTCWPLRPLEGSRVYKVKVIRFRRDPCETLILDVLDDAMVGVGHEDIDTFPLPLSPPRIPATNAWLPRRGGRWLGSPAGGARFRQIFAEAYAEGVQFAASSLFVSETYTLEGLLALPRNVGTNEPPAAAVAIPMAAADAGACSGSSPTPSPDPGFQKCLAWLRTHQDRYRGSWVVLGDDCEFFVAGAKASELLRRARSAGIREPFLHFVGDRGEDRFT